METITAETRSPLAADEKTTRPMVEMAHTMAARRARMPKRGELERRTLAVEELRVSESELRDAETGQKLIEFDGYASVFGRAYSVGRYEETIQQGAFKRSLANPSLDVVLRTEHSDLPLARTTGRVKLDDGTEVPTLSLVEDDHGLRVRALLDSSDPDVARLVPKYRRGDLREMSFAFRANDDLWSDDYTQRTIRRAEIHRGDVSIVTYGASPATDSSMRSDQAVVELREIGAEGMVGTLQDFAFQWVANYYGKNGIRATIKQLEDRAGKVLSSTSMDALAKVLDLISDADDAVDEAQPLLADLMGVPNPDADEDEGSEDDDETLTSSEQLDHLDEPKEGEEQRDDPTFVDYDVAWDLKQIKLAVANAQADQLTDPDNGTDPDDAAVLAALEDLSAAIDKAIVLQAVDGSRDEGRAELERIALEARETFTDKERKTFAESGEAMPDGSYPILTKSDVRGVVSAFGQAKDQAAVRTHICKRAEALGAEDLLPEDWRAEQAPVDEVLTPRFDEIELELRSLGGR